MSYNYEIEKHKIYTEEGLETYKKIRDKALSLIEENGAFQFWAVVKDCSGDSWLMMACLEKMVNDKEIIKISPQGTWGQFDTYVGKLYNSR